MQASGRGRVTVSRSGAAMALLAAAASCQLCALLQRVALPKTTALLDSVGRCYSCHNRLVHDRGLTG